MAAARDLPVGSFLRIQRNDSQLHAFIDQYLQPIETFNRDCNEKTDELAEFLKTRTKFSVSEVFKAGSLKKDTAIKGKADLDLVVFLNGFEDMRDFNGKQREILKELEKNITSSRIPAEIEHCGKYFLQIRLPTKVGGDYLGVDILVAPAFTNFKTAGGRQVLYEHMNGQTKKDRANYRTSLSPLQVNFVHEKIGNMQNVKKLVRLVKHWRKTHFPETEASPDLPKSYAFELLTIKCWERAGRHEKFSLKRVFKDVLTQLAYPDNIDVWWNHYYERNFYTHACQKEWGKPFILDPANPFNNVCAQSESDAWDKVAEMARLSLRSPLLSDVY